MPRVSIPNYEDGTVGFDLFHFSTVGLGGALVIIHGTPG